MKTTYIEFDAPKSGYHISSNELITSSSKKVLASILSKLFPKSKPNIEDKFKEIKYWLVEFNSETGIPRREIGLDQDRWVIMKMPVNDSYGYWTDNNLLLNDFKKHFIVSEISQEYFERNWALCDKISEFEIILSDYKTIETGADGGHVYLTTEIVYQGQKRKLVIYFIDKSEEQKGKTTGKIKIRGRLYDEGIEQSLSLLGSKLIE